MTIGTKATRSKSMFPKAVLAVTIAAASGLVGLQAMASGVGPSQVSQPASQTTVVASVAASRNVMQVAAPADGCMRQVRVITAGYNIPTQARCATKAR